ncbi:universal stress protein [Clostridium sp.]|uniref:universal stress protein n=1 Tax=Clostridium sp. TaxID=1506 RepID=UPI0026197DDB|nr:universal stress protein [uncultured Clostridium sp.]
MEKFKILVPLDGTQRSMHSLDWLKRIFSKADVSITLINVMETLLTDEMMNPLNPIMGANPTGFDYLTKDSILVLDKGMKELEGYQVDKISTLGNAADEILNTAEKDNFDLIVMTKCSKNGLYRLIGSVTSKVVRNAKVSITVIPD